MNNNNKRNRSVAIFRSDKSYENCELPTYTISILLGNAEMKIPNGFRNRFSLRWRN